MRVWVCVCIFTYLYKTEMKSGTRFMEQLLGFHVVSPDLASHLPQPLRGGSFCFSRASVCWRDLEEAAFTGERKATIKSSKNLGERNSPSQPGLLYQMKSFSSILMNGAPLRPRSAPAAPSERSSGPMPRSRENTGSPLRYAGFSMSKPVNVFLAKARA